METPKGKDGGNARLDLDADFVEISPFCDAIISLRFADGLPLNIHRSIILLQCSKLGLLIDSSTKTINLRRFSGIAGHGLVSYLYSGAYGLLNNSPTLDIELYKLKSKFEIYALARTIEFDGLEEQVRDDIERTADGLDIFTAINAVNETYPTLIGNDTWFPRWIRSLIKKTFEDPKKLSLIPLAADFGDGCSILKLLFGCMLETYSGMRTSPADQEVAAANLDLPVVEPVTAVSNGSYEDSGQAQEPSITLKPDRHPDEPVLRPQTSDEERESLRATLADRKPPPVWWTTVQSHNTSPPLSPTVSHRPEPSFTIEVGAELELARDEEPQLGPDDGIDFGHHPEVLYVEDVLSLDEVLHPRDELKPALELAQDVILEVSQEETTAGIDPWAAPSGVMVKKIKKGKKKKSSALAVEPEPEPEPEQQAEAVTSWHGFSQPPFESNTAQEAGENGGETGQISPSLGDVWGTGTPSKKKKKKGKIQAAWGVVEVVESPKEVEEPEDAVEPERVSWGF